MSIDSQVVRRSGVQVAITKVEGGVTEQLEVASSERSFRIMAADRGGLEHVLGMNEVVRVGDIPGQDPFHKVFLVKQLLNMGVLSYST